MRLPFCDHHICAILSNLSESKPIDMALSDYFKAHKSIGAKDRRTIGETLYGMIRAKGLLDYLCHSNEPLDRLRCFRSESFAKALFDPKTPEPARLGVSPYLLNRLKAAYGNQAESICRVLNTQAPTTLRPNLLKTTTDELFAILSQKFPLSKAKRLGLVLQKREPLFALEEFKQGLFEVQDEGSQMVADLIEAKPSEHVLDYCSGSGGKTLGFAHKMQGKGQIYLYDNRAHILEQARKRLKRAGVQNAQFCLPKWPVDWVLADVPCSGSGTLRRNPDAKWKIDEEMLKRLVEQQREIVEKALAHLAPKGTFVYATCSILPEENERQVEYFIQKHSLVLVKEPLLLLPEEGGCDGFFAAVFKRAPLV